VRHAAAAVVEASFREPKEGDVDWLASLAGQSDADHARWELRYARRALTYIAATRDALNDSTPAAVARALDAALESDPRVDAAKRDVAVQQFNVRLRAYRQALDERGPRPVDARLGEQLLRFCGVHGALPDEVDRAGAVLAAMLAEANQELRQAFGPAQLPDDIAPSLLMERRKA
jgi:hypothetical protein